MNARHRAWIEVDLAALVRNAHALQQHARKPIMPMVKADAYGLGVIPVARALEAVNPWGFGVATVAEGEELRAAGIRAPILVVTPPDPGSRGLKAARAANLTPALSDPHAIRTWMMIGGKDWHLAIDTGMSRAGIRWDAVGAIADELRACPPAGAFTHYHSSEADDGSMALQTQRFREAVASLPASPPLLHVENSAAIVRTSPSPWSFVRPGVFLYGVGSGGSPVPEQVVHFRAAVVDVRDVLPGETVSYNATWTAARPSRIATIAAGYADGYRRVLGNTGQVLLNGRRVPVVGTVTMDLTMLDVTDVPCAIGDIATLIGRDGEELITAEDVGAACGLSPYEILTSLRARPPRVYV